MLLVSTHFLLSGLKGRLDLFAKKKRSTCRVRREAWAANRKVCHSLGVDPARSKNQIKINDIRMNLAERVGFEPTLRLPVNRISSAAHSTTLPPLRRNRVPKAIMRTL